jgi:hypothetical protein
MKVIGYTYEADVHCIHCALERFGSKLDRNAIDSEGNAPHPIFDTDEWSESERCGDCEEELYD